MSSISFPYLAGRRSIEPSGFLTMHLGSTSFGCAMILHLVRWGAVGRLVQPLRYWGGNGAAAPRMAASPARPGSGRTQRRDFLTVIPKLFVLVFALESVARQRTTVRPSLKRLPERGLQATGTTPSTASLAVTA